MEPRKIFRRCPISLGLCFYDTYYTDPNFTPVEVNAQEDYEIIAPPLNLIDTNELGRRIVARMNPLSNGHRVMTIEDWKLLDTAILSVIESAGRKPLPNCPDWRSERPNP